MPFANAEHLQNLITAIFRASGVPKDEADTVAAHLVDAEACGVVSHGLLRVPQYVEALAAGKIVPGAKLTVLSETPATAVLDGRHGFGQVMALRATELALERAVRTGVGAVTLYNCSHTGRLGSYTAQAARRGMIGLMMVNAGGHGQWVAPFGGSAGRLSTNPLSIGVPTDGEPLVLDFATSSAAEGKVRALLTAGLSVPQGWITDHQGRPSTNPADLYGPPRGALLPFGGHKGFGLSMIVEALAGALSGAGCSCDPEAPMSGKTDGVFFVAVNVAIFCPLPDYRRHTGGLVRHVKSSPPVPGQTEVLVPGELEARTRAKRLADGIPVEAATWKALREIADRLHVEVGQPA
jgi:uncharacterized oxidoreductase